MSLNCVVCSSHLAKLDVPIKCNSCSGAFHTKCTGLSNTEIKCLSLKNRSLKYFCSTCEQGLKELPELKLLIKKLLVEVEGLKNCPLQRSNNEVCNEFIINEINERNRRASNLICYNLKVIQTSPMFVLLTIVISLSLTSICDAYHPHLELIYLLTTSPVTVVESLTPIVYNINSCNFDEMCSFLSEFDFIYNFKKLSLAATTSKFYEIIRHTFDVNVTKFKFNPHHNQNISWKDPVLRNLIQLKKQAHKQFKLSNSQNDYFTFSELRKKCKVLSVQVHANYILKIENNINSDSKYFWKYIQSLRANKTNIPATVYLDNLFLAILIIQLNYLLIISPLYTLIILKNTNLYDDTLLINHDINLNTWFISELEIADMLSALNVRSGTRPDGIPS
ncbi:hypothetical protein QTP88_017699 [Uroleucon formosanum]